MLIFLSHHIYTIWIIKRCLQLKQWVLIKNDINIQGNTRKLIKTMWLPFFPDKCSWLFLTGRKKLIKQYHKIHFVKSVCVCVCMCVHIYRKNTWNLYTKYISIVLRRNVASSFSSFLFPFFVHLHCWFFFYNMYKLIVLFYIKNCTRMFIKVSFREKKNKFKNEDG